MTRTRSTCLRSIRPEGQVHRSRASPPDACDIAGSAPWGPCLPSFGGVPARPGLPGQGCPSLCPRRPIKPTLCQQHTACPPHLTANCPRIDQYGQYDRYDQTVTYPANRHKWTYSGRPRDRSQPPSRPSCGADMSGQFAIWPRSVYCPTPIGVSPYVSGRASRPQVRRVARAPHSRCSPS